jgi:dsRNA-specific ribonuclease
MAFTHCSVGEFNYERIEFLGDAVLDIIVMSLILKLGNYEFSSEE